MATKKFASRLLVPTPLVDGEAANKAYADLKVPIPTGVWIVNPLTGYVHVLAGATSSQINAAITYAAGQASARGVMLGPGAFTVDASLAIGALSGKAFVGSGILATSLKVAAATATAAILCASGAGLAKCELRDFSLDGQWTSGAGINGVQITNASDITVRDVEVKNFGAAGILLQGLNSGGGCPRSTVRDCIIDSTGLADGTTGHGIWIKDASWSCIVSNNRVRNVKGGMGIGMSGTSGTGYPIYGQIEGNIVLDMQTSTTGFEGIGITTGCSNTIVSGNTVRTTKDNGISVTADNCTVVGNNVDDTFNHGITAGGKGTTVTGNWIRNVGKENPALGFGGICLDTGASWCIVAGNRITDDQGTHTMGFGVKINSSGGNNRVGPNSIDGWLTAAYSGFGTTDLVIDAESYANGFAFNRIYIDAIAAKTLNATIGISAALNATNLSILGAGASKNAQVTAFTNAGSTRANLALPVATGQVAPVLKVLDSSDNVISQITKDGAFTGTGITIPTNAAANRALLSDANGNGTWQALTKALVGLDQVDNTADANKAVLSATKLATARTINGVSFDGTQNITIATAAPTIGWASEIVVNSQVLTSGYNDMDGGVLIEPGPNGNGVLLDAIAVRIGDAATNLAGGDLQIQIQLGSPTTNQTTLVTTITLTNGSHDLVAVLGSAVACAANTVLRANIVLGTATLAKSLYIQYRGRVA